MCFFGSVDYLKNVRHIVPLNCSLSRSLINIYLAWEKSISHCKFSMAACLENDLFKRDTAIYKWAFEGNPKLSCQFAILRSLIGRKNSTHFLSRLDAKMKKPIATWSLAFSRTETNINRPSLLGLQREHFLACARVQRLEPRKPLPNSSVLFPQRRNARPAALRMRLARRLVSTRVFIGSFIHTEWEMLLFSSQVA